MSSLIRGNARPAYLLLLVALFGLSLLADDAEAANTRVAITDYNWSKNPEIDLGETVIWDWLGPDLSHSVTGQGPNGPIDSDSDRSIPKHRAGDTFRVVFDRSGTYSFVCKIHSVVGGTVTVSDRPGQPDSDPGLQPPLFVDDQAPLLTDLLPFATRLGPGGRGGMLRFGVDESAEADLEYWRIIGNSPFRPLRYAGFSRWQTHVGFNDVRYGSKTEDFAARPGRYLARLRVTDASNNIAGPVEFQFKIAAPKKPGR